MDVQGNTEGAVVRKTLIVLLLVGLALLLVPLSGTLLLIFSAILIAVLIRSAAAPFRMLGIPETPAVLLGVLAIFAILYLVGWLFGAQLGQEFSNVAAQLPSAIDSARDWLRQQPWGQSLSLASLDLQSYFGRAVSFAFGAVGAITNLVLVVIGAIYFALQPGLYVRGAERLFPKEQGPRVVDALNASGVALQKYLLGQLFTMTVVGSLVAIGLTFVGLPSAGALGVIVGVANFIPLVGPVIGAIPGILLAFAQGPDALIAASLVYLVAQQAEGNVLTPLVQRWAVSIPPALLLFALGALGSLFGILGILLAAPLAVVLYTLVTMLWSRDALGYDVRVPGRRRSRGDDVG